MVSFELFLLANGQIFITVTVMEILTITDFVLVG